MLSYSRILNESASGPARTQAHSTNCDKKRNPFLYDGVGFSRVFELQSPGVVHSTRHKFFLIFLTMGCKDYFRKANKEKNDFCQRLGEHPLLLGFNIAAGATVLLPLFMWMIARLIREDGEGNRAAEDGGQGATLGFVYIWSLVAFGCIIWHGNQVLERDSKELLKVLLASLAVFCNLAFLLSVFTGSLAVSANCRSTTSVVSHCIIPDSHHD
jgi:hypothetical protein